MADEPATAWAEWYRALAGTGLPPAHALPRDIWRWHVELDRVALLDHDERLRRVGLPSPLPTASQWPACQAIGDRLHHDGYQAILVASAARPQQRNLVVFRSTRHVTGCIPQPPPTPIMEVDLYGISVALMQWGDRWLVEDPPLSLQHKSDHGAVEQILRCKDCGETLSVFDVEYRYEPEAVHKHAQKGSTAASPD